MSNLLKKLDWLAALACIAWGAYLAVTGDAKSLELIFWIGGGIFGLFVAWLDLPGWLESRMKSRYIRKSPLRKP